MGAVRNTGAAATVAAGIAAAAAMAAPQEGYRGYVYRDPIGVLTYCYGETENAKDMAGRKFSEAECRALLTKRMAHYEQGNAKCVSNYEQLDVYVQQAFNDFSYNLGNGTFCNGSVSRLLRSGDVKGACLKITDFNKARVHGVLKPLPGLTKRRALEQMYCLKGSH
ncbi:glycoside hydrolase family protein [Mesorhizobium salmacidum]|uniref:Lysozyme n=1 Tax=Mesorhizobium salmacidum TaxID=3015171 RepID=A0ABU8KYD7_9HYPH